MIGRRAAEGDSLQVHHIPDGDRSAIFTNAPSETFSFSSSYQRQLYHWLLMQTEEDPLKIMAASVRSYCLRE